MFLFLFGISGTQTVNAIDEFCDYLPKYRKFQSHYQIDKIEYQEKRTVIFFRFIVQKSENHAFFNSSHPKAWYLRTPPRNRSLKLRFRQLDIANIAVNNEIILNSLSSIPEVHYNLNRGDVITCELHFERFGPEIRMLDLIDGEGGDWDQNKFNCLDIMIKTKGNPLLGKSENAKLVVSSFEKTFNYVKPKVSRMDPVVASTGSKSNPYSDKTASGTSSGADTYTTVISSRGNIAIENNGTPEPIDYMPNALKQIEDLQCNSRIYMPNVVFKENDVKFSGRIKAIQNLRIVVQYLKDYKSARLNLYGHTDIYGNKKRNLELSRERAVFVKRELVRMGAKSSQISIFFFGGERPLKKYKNGSNLNRRVEVEPVCVN